MLNMAMKPPSEVNESCIEFTAPVDVRVDVDANSVDPQIPNRCSLPSIAPPASRVAAPPVSVSKSVMAVSETAKIDAITARIAVPWRLSPTIWPKVRVSANGIASMRKISNRFVQAVGFSNGCDEFALKNPPPLLPSILIASCEATGPPGIDCVPPVMVATESKPLKFWMTPPAIKMIAAMNESGNSSRSDERVRSTQKLPTVPDLR